MIFHCGVAQVALLHAHHHQNLQSIALLTHSDARFILVHLQPKTILQKLKISHLESVLHLLPELLEFSDVTARDDEIININLW
jgi:hypothetical protein